MNQKSENKNQSQTNEIMHKPIIYFFTILTLMVVFTSCKDKATCSQDAVNRDSIDSDTLFIDSIICDLQNDTLLTGIDLENARFYMKRDSTFKLTNQKDNLPNNYLYGYFDFENSKVSVFVFMDGKCVDSASELMDEDILQVLEKYRYSGCLLQFESLPLELFFTQFYDRKARFNLWVLLYNNLSYVIKCKKL